ncbi:MAG: OmpA family protein [Bacteroidia bacterium]|nr:OmpA family protein [Bacteroidia bacterium]
MNYFLKHLLSGVFILSFLQSAKSQNFVADSSFEHNKYIPLILSSIGANNSWSAPTMGTTDLFCECSKKDKAKSESQVPNNPMGIQKANSGKCYAGFYLFSHHDYREFLITQLTAPLTGGVKYDVTFYLSLADYSRATIEQIGVCLLKGSVTYTSSGYITGLKPNYIKINEEVGTDTVEWHKVSLEYMARGGEQYLLIGGFDEGYIGATNVKAPKSVHTRINQRTDRDAYYYIDDVSLRKQPPVYVAYFDTIVKQKIDTIKPTVFNSPTIDSAGNANPHEISLDKPLILNNVLFETGEAKLLPSSFAELDSVAVYLNNKSLLKIEISGHTDNKGSETINQTLSEKRAQAVADYLVSKKIEPTRITFKGFGSQKPITTNDTEAGRKLNRRVEFMLFR